MAGVADTATIDIVAQDAAGDFLLIMVETRPWGSDRDQLLQLREKINTYAGFVLNGDLERHYPETRGQPVAIQLDCPEPPAGEFADVANFAQAELKKLGIGFRINVRR